MFSRKIDTDTEIRLSLPQYAEEIFTLTDTNRSFLRQWLPWLDQTQTAADTREFIVEQLHRFAKGEAVHVTIFVSDSVAGVAGFNQIDRANGIGTIGYWLAEKYNGRGIMTRVVSDLIAIARDTLMLQKIDIRCATNNHKSRAVPERLKFHHEGTLRRAENLYGTWVNHEIYALLLPYGEGDTPNP
ncbi:MAG: GNAT family N-acetyltransferase [Verrucomicrobiae bacterium]|nr:GNAT family N-acetyltransferase [Verrucomicrobiae bacterium]